MVEPLFGINPVSFIIIKGFPFLLLLLILLNMIQKRFLRNWEPKRKATMAMFFLTAGLVILSVLVVKFGLADLVFLPVAPAVAALLIVKRDLFFPFTFKCGNCGKIVSPRDFLCANDNLCTGCRGSAPEE
jgi:hypothetical protein